MKKSTFIRKTGFYLLYEYKGQYYTVDTRDRLTEQHRRHRDLINMNIQRSKQS